jgi:branched-chain amino acid transport system permease protein
MEVVLSLIVAGVMLGTLYGLLGFTLTLMFRSTGVLSFAHAGFALIASFMYSGFACPTPSGGAQCAAQPTLNPVPNAIVSVLTATVVAILLERLVIRPLQNANSAIKALATAAVLGLGSGVMLQLYGSVPRYVPPAQQLFPQGDWTIFNVVVNYQRGAIFVLSVALVVALAMVLRKSWFGLGVRAAGQLPDVARLMGLRPASVSRFNWAIGGALSGLAGVLIAPITVVNIGTFSFLLVKAVAAALIGGLVSLPITFAAGIGLGVIETVLPRYWHTEGGPAVGIAILVIVALYANRHRLALFNTIRRGEVEVTGPPSDLAVAIARPVYMVSEIVRRVPKLIWAGAFAAFLFIPITNEYYGAVGVNVLFNAALSLSLVVVLGMSGQPSLMQMSFAGIGAYSIATGLSHGQPFLAAMAIGLVICFVLGLATGFLALRFRGVEFAIVTLTLAAVVSEFFLTNPHLKNSVESPKFLGHSLLDSNSVFLVMGAFTLVAFVAVWNLRRSFWGRSLLSLRETSKVLAHFGVDPTRMEAVAFSFSAVIAGLAGIIYALLVGLFGPFQFVPLISIIAALGAVVGGVRSLAGPVLAGLILGYGPTLVQDLSTNAANAYPQIISGLLAVIVLVKLPGGLASIFSWSREIMARAAEATDGVPTFRGRPLPVAADIVPARRLAHNGQPALRVSHAAGRTTDGSPLVTLDPVRLARR